MNLRSHHKLWSKYVSMFYENAYTKTLKPGFPFFEIRNPSILNHDYTRESDNFGQ